MLRDHSDFHVRPAKNDDGDRIGWLCAKNGFGPDQMGGWEIDWSDVEPYWLVAEDAQGIVGAIQLCPGKPVARLEMLVLHPNLRKRERGALALMLNDYGILMARMYGAQMISGMIPDELTGYAHVAEHRGYVAGQSGTLYFKRVV